MIQCDALGREKQQKTSDMLRMLDAAKKSVAEWGGEERNNLLPEQHLSNRKPQIYTQVKKNRNTDKKTK